MTKPSMGIKEDSTEIFYEQDLKYEITINPEKQYQMKVDRMQKVYADLVKWLECRKMDYNLVVEISEPTYGNKDRGSLPRIHWHGWVLFRDDTEVYDWLLYGIYTLTRWADYQINTMREDYWDKYMAKQSGIMIPCCRHYHIPYMVNPSSITRVPGKVVKNTKTHFFE